MKRNFFSLLLLGCVLGLAVGVQAQDPTPVLPDLQPIWPLSIVGMQIDTARAADRLVSCDDWTEIDPTPITGQRVITFVLGSPNVGEGHMMTRRESIGSEWVWYQTISMLNPDGTCSAVEQEIARQPAGQDGRWLPLGKFALYEVAEDGGVGRRVSCQIKRWCCLSSGPTCPVNPPCPYSCPGPLGDCLRAGSRDVYPLHWLDQFILVEGLPSGLYWFEHEMNPLHVIIESNYDNNSMFFLIELNQEAPPGTPVRIVQEPQDPPGCPAAGGCNPL